MFLVKFIFHTFGSALMFWDYSEAFTKRYILFGFGCLSFCFDEFLVYRLSIHGAFLFFWHAKDLVESFFSI